MIVTKNNNVLTTSKPQFKRKRVPTVVNADLPFKVKKWNIQMYWDATTHSSLPPHFKCQTLLLLCILSNTIQSNCKSDRNHFCFGYKREKLETLLWEFNYDILCLLKKYQKK